LEHSSRIGAGRYDRFRKPPANDGYLRIAGIDCVVFAPRQTPRCRRSGPGTRWTSGAAGPKIPKIMA